MRNQKKTLMDRLMIYDMDLIKYAFPFLKYNYRQILLKAYGLNLTGEINTSSLNRYEVKNVLVSAVKSLKNIIDHTDIMTVTIQPNNSNYLFFYQYFKDYNPKDVFKIVQELDEIERKLLQAVYGRNLLERFHGTNLFEHEKSFFWNIMNEIDNRLSTFSKVVIDSPTTYFIGYDYKPFFTGPKPKSIVQYYSNYSLEEIRKAISQLKMEDQIYIREAYGINYDDVSGYRQMSAKEKDHIAWIVKYVLKNHLNNLATEHIAPTSEEQLDSASEDVDEGINYFEELFLNYSIDTVLEVVNSLKDEEILVLKKAYGNNFKDNFYNELSGDEQNIVDFLLRKISRKCSRLLKEKINRGDINMKEGIVTNSIVNDRLLSTKYKKLSRQDEIIFIKKAKLSYYDSVDDELKAKYLEFYMEVFPEFRIRYQNAVGDEKDELLREAIKDSLMYRNLFIENNLRLVFTIAKKYSAIDEIENLYQEGTTGLIKAIKKFDVEAGYKFSTYAYDWILQPIRKYIPYYSYSVHLPIYKRDQLSSMGQISDNFVMENGREPSMQELAELMDISLEKLHELSNVQNVAYQGSLDEPIGVDTDTSFIDMIVNDESLIEDIVESKVDREAFLLAVERTNLTRLEKRILFLHYGIADGIIHTVDEIAIELSITPGRIHSIEKKALMKLKTNPEIMVFKDTDFSSIAGDLDEKSLVKKRN